MRLQSTHNSKTRGLDAYFTPPEATYALCAIENLPHSIWEPACGDGAISKILIEKGHDLRNSDIEYYGYPCIRGDYLHLAKHAHCQGIVTNPPYKLALKFIQKALCEVSYSAWLLRTNFLELNGRYKNLFTIAPPTRQWISVRRLPRMHRLGYTGPRAPSNICYSWFIWDSRTSRQIKGCETLWFDWAEYQPIQQLPSGSS